MITQILVTVCLMIGAPGFVADPDRDCETFPIQLQSPLTPAACAGIAGQSAVLEALRDPYFEFHRLARYSCTPGEPV